MDGVNILDDNTVIIHCVRQEKATCIARRFQWFWHQPSTMMRRSVDGNTLVQCRLNPWWYRYHFWWRDLEIGDPYGELVWIPWNDQYISSSQYPNLPPFPMDGQLAQHRFRINEHVFNGPMTFNAYLRPVGHLRSLVGTLTKGRCFRI